MRIPYLKKNGGRKVVPERTSDGNLSKSTYFR